MLKQFIACATPKERFDFFDHTKIADWSDEEFEAIADILGVAFDAADDDAKKYLKIRFDLEKKAK